MAREQVAPTKSNLTQMKVRLSTATEGYELLDQKREILVMELLRTVEQVKLLQKELDQRIDTAWPALRRMLVKTGREQAERLSRGVEYAYTVRERRTTVAGMNLPALDLELPRMELKYSPANSFAECDETVLEFFALLEKLGELAAVRTIAWRLAREVRKTQRRVNALEKMVIPSARDTIHYIQSSLEERDRESFFSAKLLKRKAENA
jgi:V/A-type H+/Na+-transporting ATPase subunit D